MGYRRSHYRRPHVRNTKYGRVSVSGSYVRSSRTNSAPTGISYAERKNIERMFTDENGRIDRSSYQEYITNQNKKNAIIGEILTIILFAIILLLLNILDAEFGILETIILVTAIILVIIEIMKYCDIKKENDILSHKEQKKRKRISPKHVIELIIISVLCIVLICFTGGIVSRLEQIQKEDNERRITRETRELEEYWQKQFRENDYERYISEIRKQSNLSDLEINVELKYDPSVNYYPDNSVDEKKTLRMKGVICYFSDEIDKYYTEEYGGTESHSLLQVLKNIRNAQLENNSHYEYECSEGKALCYIDNDYSMEEIHVKTSSGHDYEFEDIVGWETVIIDGKTVYKNNPGIKAGTIGISGNPEKAMTREEAQRLKGTGYHNTRPGSMAESIELGAAQVKCKICGMHSDNGRGSKCDYCIRKYGYY